MVKTAKRTNVKKIKVNVCVACNVSHASPTWYGKKRHKVCKAVYERQRRVVHRMNLKGTVRNESGSSSWRAVLLPQVNTQDRKKYFIHSVGVRPDWKAIQLALHAMTESKTPAWRLWFYGAWCVFLYWSWPCLAFISTLQPREKVKAKDIEYCFNAVVDMYRHYRIVNGELVPHSSGTAFQGLRDVGRDKDRGYAIPRGRRLCRETKKWKRFARR